jgi:citrate synthase
VHPRPKKVDDNRLIRPRARYTGPDLGETTFVPLDER